MEAKRALVIDDEKVILDSVSAILAAEAYRVDVCLNAKGGVHQALKDDYDIVLTDIKMPEMDGMEVLKNIKSVKPETPVVVITGYGSVQSAVEALKLGATDYIEKPFTPDELVEAVEKAVDLRMVHEAYEEQYIHKDELVQVLRRVCRDPRFARKLLANGHRALAPYRLDLPERMAVLTGDLKWLEAHLGPLEDDLTTWLTMRMSVELW